jgi:nucleoid-associated protein YgaU
LVKAEITAEETGAKLECMFNPKELSVTRSNQFTAGQTAGATVQPQEFGSGQPQQLKLQLFFDTFTGYSGSAYPQKSSMQDAKDVRLLTDKLWKMMDATVEDKQASQKSKKKRPPIVAFVWGSLRFEGVITSISQQFTLFSSEGYPVRATLDLQIQQFRDQGLLPAQNPTSGGLGGERIWTVQQGETLQWIAYQEYGDPNLWRGIADANRLSSVRRLAAGTRLVIPTI